MTVKLSEDLRQVVHQVGTPLTLVDPTSGETYVLIRESAFADVRSILASDEDALREAQIPNTRLLQFARQNRPPAEWLEGEEESLF